MYDCQADGLGTLLKSTNYSINLLPWWLTGPKRLQNHFTPSKSFKRDWQFIYATSRRCLGNYLSEMETETSFWWLDSKPQMHIRKLFLGQQDASDPGHKSPLSLGFSFLPLFLVWTSGATTHWIPINGTIKGWHGWPEKRR